MSLKKQLLSGVFYSAAGRYSNIIFNLLITAVLARLLSPDEFGLVAIAMVIASFFGVLSYFLIPAIIQNKYLSDVDYHSIFTATMLFGICVLVSLIVVTPYISFFYEDARLDNILYVISVGAFFNIANAPQRALLSKAKLFKRIASIEVISNVVTGLLAVILAINGFGYYSLAIKFSFNVLLIFILFHFYCPVRLRLSFIRIDSILKIKEFAKSQLLVSLTTYISRNTDTILIGKFLGTELLGFYDKAYRLMLLPVQNISTVIGPVLHPVLSVYEDEKVKIYYSYIRLSKILAVISFPIGAFSYSCSSEIVTVIFGANWLESVVVFKILSLSLALQIMSSTSGSIFKALNRPDLLLKTGLVSSFLFVSSVIVGIKIHESLIYVSVYISISFIVSFFVANFILIKMALNQKMRIFLSVLVVPSMNFLVVMAALEILNMSNYFSELPLIKLIVAFAITAVLTWLVYFFSNRKDTIDISMKSLNRIKRLP